MEHVIEFCKPESGSDLALQPCPFCGNDEIVYARYQHAAGERWMALCTGCMASIDPGYAQTKDAVQTLWNRRAQSPDHNAAQGV